MKRKLGVLCLVLLLSVSGINRSLAAASNTIDLWFMNAFERSANEWYGTETDRALLTFVVAVELAEMNLGLKLSDLYLYDSYVGRDGDIMMVAYQTSGDSACYAMFSPETDQGTCGILSSNSGTYIEYAMSELDMEYKKNTSSSMGTAATMLEMILAELQDAS